MKKLTKSSTDVKIAGVCAGIAEYFSIDPTIVRIIYLLLTFAGVGSPILLYFILAWVIPEG